MNDNNFKTKVKFSGEVETRSWCWVSSCRCSLTFSHSWRFPTPPISMRPRIQHLLIQTGFFKSFLWNDFFFKSIRILQFPPFQDTCDLHCLFTWLLWCLLQHTSGLEMTWFNCLKKKIICLKILQITSILGGVFKEQSSSAFAIFKFMQSLSAAIAFFYSPYLRY